MSSFVEDGMLGVLGEFENPSISDFRVLPNMLLGLHDNLPMLQPLLVFKR